MQRARRILAEKQAAWDSTWKRIDTEKEDTMTKGMVHYLFDDGLPACGKPWKKGSAIMQDVTCMACKNTVNKNEGNTNMAKRIHFLNDDDECPCGFEWEDDEQVSDDIDEVSCKKCIKAAEELGVLEEDDDSDEEDETEEKEEVSAPVPLHLKAIFTLAPRNRDMDDTKEAPCTWLYQGAAEQGLNQPIRKVLVPQVHVESQINTYLHPIPYLTFQEQSLEKYIAQGKVTEAPVSAEVLAEQPSLDINTIAPEKEKAMPKKPIVKVQTTTKPVATITEVVHANMPAPSALSALDAILAQPIAHIMQQAPVGVPEEFLTRLVAPKRPLALPEERSEDALVQGMNPGGIPPVMYKAFLAAFKQALKEEGLVIVPETSLHHGCGEASAPVPEPEIWGSILDVPTMPAPVAPPVWGSELDAPVAPVKPKSTLQVFTGTNKAAPKSTRASNGKTDPAIIKAIQTAWNKGGITQESLAAKHGMDSKRVWYLVNRAPQLA